MPGDSAENNAWRTLAKALGVPHNVDVVRIPDLHDALLERARWDWDQPDFRPWFDRYFGGRDIDPRDVYPEWRFNHQVEADGHSGFTPAGRNSFLCLYAKMRHEGLWPEVSTVRWVGETGEMLCFPRHGSDGLRERLQAAGYGDYWLAGKDARWGVRSRYRGAQLHARGYGPDAPDNIHIDLHNPGDPIGASDEDSTGPLSEIPDALLHWFEDLRHRPQSHQWPQLRDALAAQGVPLLPVVP